MSTETMDRKAIRRLIVLPWRKSLEITLKNLRVRFFRSLITLSSLALAVAFLTFVFVSADVARGLFESGTADNLKMLTQAGFDVDAANVGLTASPKERWIVILSMLVCTVGIINAQLMSVTERFREIGVLKCLGALDIIILRLFLLEAALQGLAGALIGTAAGVVFGLLQGLLRFGFAALTNLAVSDMLGSVAMAIGIGCLLSLVGVLYPAWVASRMPPINAIRAEL